MLLWVDNSKKKKKGSSLFKSLPWVLIAEAFKEFFQMAVTYLSSSQHPLQVPSLHSFSSHTMHFLYLIPPPLMLSVQCPSPTLTWWNLAQFSKASFKVPFFHEAFLGSTSWKYFPQHFVHSSWHLSYLYIPALWATILSSSSSINSFKEAVVLTILLFLPSIATGKG